MMNDKIFSGYIMKSELINFKKKIKIKNKIKKIP